MIIAAPRLTAATWPRPTPRRLRIAALVIGALIASGCARQGPPAPIEDRGNLFFGRGTAVPVARPAAERPTRGTAMRAPLVTSPGVVTVQAGDSLYGLSRKHNVPIRAIINANNLAPPYDLTVGRSLVLPRQAYHRVAPGETVGTIARTYGVSTQDLVRSNSIEPPYLIYVGQPILLPITTAQVAQSSSAVRGSGGQSATSPSQGPSNAAPSKMPSSPAISGPGGSSPQPATTPGAGDGPTAETSPDVYASLPPPSPIEEPPISAPPGAFIWPVQGTVISGFGSKPGGLVNDGINIGAPIGTPVRASQDGTIAYAGNELRGYGNLLLVRHDNGWVTAYAHNGELLVGKGDRVRRGQVIARVGATGNVSQPQLHFELRQGTRSVDPTRFLSGQGVTG